ncbi:hypothetical protein [Streptomyces sp. NPDC086838]|uniref:hypothetical protein n=1 Tax=Streptomyces sp. NPDC086838 TaxID=3365762 RepID=UPI00380382D3
MTATKTPTFEQVVAANAETLNYLLDQDDVTALTPDDFIDALSDAARVFTDSFESSNQANGEAFTAAAALLAEALPLPSDDPDMPVLLSRARARLLDAEI